MAAATVLGLGSAVLQAAPITTATSRSRTRSHGAAARFSPPSGGVVFLADSLSGLAWLAIAIAIVVAGLASLVGPGVTRVALLWAGLTAATIGTYTTLDAAGARRPSGLGYGIESSVILGGGRGVVVPPRGQGRARLGSALVVTAGLVLLIVWQ